MNSALGWCVYLDISNKYDTQLIPGGLNMAKATLPIYNRVEVWIRVVSVSRRKIIWIAKRRCRINQHLVSNRKWYQHKRNYEIRKPCAQWFALFGCLYGWHADNHNQHLWSDLQIQTKPSTYYTMFVYRGALFVLQHSMYAMASPFISAWRHTAAPFRVSHVIVRARTLNKTPPSLVRRLTLERRVNDLGS